MAGTATAIFESRFNRAINPWHSSHAALVTPLSYAIGLFTSNAGLETGTPSGEVSSVNTGYVRQSFTLDDNGANAADITFPVPNPSGFGTVLYSGIFAEVSSGVFELWFWARIQDPNTLQDVNLTLNAGSAPFWVKAGDLMIVPS